MTTQNNNQRCQHRSYCCGYVEYKCNRKTYQDTCLLALDIRFLQREQTKEMLKNLEDVIFTTKLIDTTERE